MRNLILKLKNGIALIARVRDDFFIKEYVVASGYIPEDGTWGWGKYYGPESICAAARAFELTADTVLRLADVPEYIRRNGLYEVSISLDNVIIYVFERGDGDYEYNLYNVKDGRAHDVDGGVLEAESIEDAYRSLTKCIAALRNLDAEAELFAGSPEEVI